MIRHDSRRAVVNRFPLATPEMVTVKLRTFGFLAVVLVELLFSSCAVAPRRVGPAPAGAAELKITQDIIPQGKCGRPLNRPICPTSTPIHSTDNTSCSAD